MPDTNANPAPRETEPHARPDPHADAATWVADYLDAVFAYVRRRLNVEDAHDVTQQAFEALFSAFERGRTPEDVGAYLFGTARRRVADLFRRRARRGEQVGLPEGWEGYIEHPLPAAVLETEELRALVQVALGLLSCSARAVLLAYYQGGHSVAEVATRLGVTPKAAELRLRRARTAFSERFRSVGQDWTNDWEGREPAGAPPRNDPERHGA